MPWVRDILTNKHVFHRMNEPVTTTVPTISAPATTSSEKTINTGSASRGTWVEYTGQPTTTNAWFIAAATLNHNSPPIQVQPAQEHSKCVAGVVTDTNRVQTDGTVLAWVIRKKRTLDLSGLYDTSRNGVHVSKTAIIQNGNLFLMARSRDDDVEKLKEQFSELCS